MRNWLQLNQCFRKFLEKFIVAELVNKFTSSMSTKIWRFKSCGMWRCVVGQVVPDVSKDRSAFKFTGYLNHWWRRHYGLSKRRKPLIKRHRVTSQKTWIPLPFMFMYDCYLNNTIYRLIWINRYKDAVNRKMRADNAEDACACVRGKTKLNWETEWQFRRAQPKIDQPQIDGV